MLIAADDRDTGLVPDATQGRRALSVVLVINGLTLTRTLVAGTKRAKSAGAPA